SDPVELRVEGHAGEAIVRVVDRGPGLSDHDVERIFEPFERAGRQPVGRGSGLGLAIARGFAAANGGRLWAQSPPGGGAEFVPALPQAQVPARVRSGADRGCSSSTTSRRSSGRSRRTSGARATRSP